MTTRAAPTVVPNNRLRNTATNVAWNSDRVGQAIPFPNVASTYVAIIYFTRQATLDAIQELPDHRFELLRPIPVTYTEWSGSVVASFEEADVSISGSSREDAHELLAHWVVDLFGDLLDEPTATLGRVPARQLTVLREYIRRVDG